MTKAELRQKFESIAGLQDSDINLDEAALVIAAETQPEFDIPEFIGHLDDIAHRFENVYDKNTAMGISIESLIKFIHSEEGFGGNVKDFYDLDNSYLNRVLETRTGIPITLALVHIALGSRLNIPVKGINFPGHFLIKYGSEPNQLIVDPFSGRILSEPDCGTLLKQIAGPKAVLQPSYLEIAENKDILIRVLDNLKKIFWQEKSWDRSKSCIERQMLLKPDHEEFLVQLGAVYEMQGNLPLAQMTYTNILHDSDDAKLKQLASKRLLAMQGNSATVH